MKYNYPPRFLGVSVHPLSHKLEWRGINAKISPALRATDYKCPHCFFMIDGKKMADRTDARQQRQHCQLPRGQDMAVRGGRMQQEQASGDIVDNPSGEAPAKALCVASRGRGENNAQHFEARADGCTNTITSVIKDNLLMETNNDNSGMEYRQHPTKEDLLEYFGRRIRIRKMSPREALRLMDVDDADIDKMINATETVTLKDGTVKTKNAISKTAQYRLAGNSIVANCLYNIFRTMLIPGQPENQNIKPIQLTLFE